MKECHLVLEINGEGKVTKAYTSGSHPTRVTRKFMPDQFLVSVYCAKAERYEDAEKEALQSVNVFHDFGFINQNGLLVELPRYAESVELAAMECEECGAFFGPNKKYCPYCGWEVENDPPHQDLVREVFKFDGPVYEEEAEK